MSTRSQRYTALMKGGTVFQLSSSSSKVMKALINKELTYSQLRKRTKMPENSLYVHVSRLKKSNLVTLRRDSKLTVRIKASKDVVFPNTKYVG